MTLRGRVLLACLVGFVIADPAQGQHAPQFSPVVGATELFYSDPASGSALGGRDPITYFLLGGPTPGTSDHELIWSGVGWRFTSESNRAAFENNPLAFAPRFGGYDAEAVSRGRIVDANPALFVVRDNRLYLFRNDANRARFMADGAIAGRGEEQWTRLKNRLVKP